MRANRFHRVSFFSLPPHFSLSFLLTRTCCLGVSTRLCLDQMPPLLVARTDHLMLAFRFALPSISPTASGGRSDHPLGTFSLRVLIYSVTSGKSFILSGAQLKQDGLGLENMAAIQYFPLKVLRYF